MKNKTVQSQHTREFHINHWQSMPFMRLLIPFVIGILSNEIFHLQIASGILFCCCLVAVYFIWVTFLFPIVSYHRRIYMGLFLISMFFILGNVWVNFRNTSDQVDFFIRHLKKNSMAEVVVTEPAADKPGRAKILVKVIRVYTSSNKYLETEGNMLLYAADNEWLKQLTYGQRILIPLRPQPTVHPKNPGSFDYKKYLARKQIYFTQYLKTGEYKMLSGHIGNRLITYAYFLKERIINIYRTYIPDKKQSGVATALIFGYKDDLDQELVNAYAHTGTLHVLAVSGLHVGIIYAVMGILLNRLPKKRRTKIFKAIMSICLLWFYALLTGFSPSVMRAALMFSLMAIGEGITRHTNIYNSLASSAFILLLIDPMLIYDVGFQLSYSAVLGIIYLHPKLYCLFEPNSAWVDHIWNISSVSIAAQIATFPLGIYYFHQFPNYFLLSNLIIIPLSTFITYLGLLLLLFSAFSPLAFIIGWLLDRLIYITDWIVYKLDKLPYATTNDLNFNIYEAFGMAIFVYMLIFYFVYKKKFCFYTGAVALLLLLTYHSWQSIHYQSRHEAWVYHVKGQTIVSFIDGRTASVWADTSHTKFDQSYLYAVRPHLISAGVKEISMFSNTINLNKSHLKKIENLYQWNHKSLYILSDDYIPTIHDSIDCLVLSQSCKHSLIDISKHIKCRQMIVDGNNKVYIQKMWKKEAEGIYRNIYFTEDSGAFCLQ